MEFDTQFSDATVPFGNAVNSEMIQVADEGVSKDFSSSATYGRVLDCIVNVANQRDTFGGRDHYFFCCGQILRGQYPNMSRYKVESGAKSKMPIRVGVYGALTRNLIIVEESADCRICKWIRHEW